MAEAAEGMWRKYRVWFEANLESLEEMAARSDPLHLPLDEQDTQRFATNSAKERFDELAEGDYLQWVSSGLPHEAFSARLSALHAQVLTASIEVWSVGSKILRQWYENNCQPPADGALCDKVARWEHRARTTEIVRYLSRDRGLAIKGFVMKLEKLTAEEALEIPSWADGRRLKAYVDPERCRIRGSHSGDFLESVRVVTRDLGIQMGPPSGVLPIQCCLQLLFRELVCEREPLIHPQIDRLDDEQLNRYLWAPYSGNSITPESGQIFNLCGALKWYCQRTIGLFDSPDVLLRVNGAVPKIRAEKSRGIDVATGRRGRHRNQGRRDAIRNAIVKHGDVWRDHLSEIYKELDAGEVSLGSFHVMKIDLDDGESVKVQKWDDLDLAQGKQLKQIMDTLRKYAY